MSGHRKPVQERSRRTYDTLLDTAAHLLGEVGIEKLSANLVCERAGVTPPAFYRYFDDKQAIVIALAERLMGQQNRVMEAWIARHGHGDLASLAAQSTELMRQMHAVTSSAPGGLWIMRALRAMPALTHLRLTSHNYVADLLTDLYQPHYPHVPRALLRRRTRLSVEMAYAMDEMLKEGEADAETLFDDAAHVFRAMYDYPDYAPPPAN